MAKQTLSKTDYRYWLRRVERQTFTRNGERHQLPNYSMRLAGEGKRIYIPLDTPNREAAAKRAADIYRERLSMPWAEFVKRYKRGALGETGERKITVGDVLTAAQQRAATLKPPTLAGYAGCLRQIAAFVAGIEAGREKHDYYNGKNLVWREKVDAVPLETLTRQRIREWQTAYLKAAKDPLDRQRKTTSVNSIMAQASRLFSGGMLQHYTDAGLEVTNPFAGVKPLPKQSTRYTQRFSAGDLLALAQKELAGEGGTGTQAFRIVILSLVCGLRRGEVDRLQWTSVNFDGGFLVVASSADGTVKGSGSTRTIGLSESMVAELRRWRAEAKSLYVVEEEGGQAKPAASYRNYRAHRAFERALKWLKEKLPGGVAKPLHHLRKEAGAMVAESRGIYHAATMLGHRDVRVTEMHYAHLREHVGTGLDIPAAVLPDAIQATGSES